MSNAPTRYATAYEHSIEFGGPEEGGWYYTRYSVILSVPVTDADEEAATLKAEGLAREAGFIFLGDKVPDIRGNPRPARPASSASPEVNAMVIIEDEVGENETRSRPRYE